MSDRFAHRLKLDQVHDGERVDLVADEAERKSVAERLGLESLDCLQAHGPLLPETSSVLDEHPDA